MAEIRPWRGLRYDGDRAGDLGRLVLPHYDALTPTKRLALKNRSPCNIAHLDYPQESGSIAMPQSRLRTAQARLREWWQQGILRRDATPALYLERHCFRYEGQEHERRILYGVALLEKDQAVGFRPHEATSPSAYLPHLRFLRATRVHIASVVALYEDPGGRTLRRLRQFETQPPLSHFVDTVGEAHTLWRIEGETQLQEIVEELRPRPLYIADGHHRYAAALAYLEERAGRAADPARYIPVALISLEDPGLKVASYHRLLRGLTAGQWASLEGLLATLPQGESFSLERPLGDHDLQRILARLHEESFWVGVVDARSKRLRLIRLPEISPAMARTAPVEVLHQRLLEPILGKDPAAEEEGRLSYTPHPEEAVEEVLRGRYQIAFLLGSPPLSAIKAAADEGRVLPAKSTRFYPKPPVGLLLFALEGAPWGGNARVVEEPLSSQRGT